MTEKKCFRCKGFKQITDFPKSPSMANGYLNQCKKCKSQYDKERWLNPETYKKRMAWHKKYRESPKGKVAIAKRARGYRSKHPRKIMAIVLVRSALKSGKLLKPIVCENCDKKCKLVGHHDDYALPLVVRWLCQKCHLGWHAGNGEGLNGRGELGDN